MLNDAQNITVEEEDDILNDLLKKWNSSNMFETLKAERITFHVLKIINFQQLEDLTREWKMGDKVLFTYNLQKWREDLGVPVSTEYNFRTSTNCLRHVNFSLDQSSVNSSDADDDKLNVAQILQEHTKGKQILEMRTSKKSLSDEERNLVINIIVQYFDKHGLHLSLQVSYKLEKDILELFPGEKLSFYRSERRGRIYTKYMNVKKNGKIASEDEMDNKPNKSVQKPKYKFTPEPDADATIHSLKFDNLCVEEFENVWSACTYYRLNQIFNKFNNLGDILTEWPQYKNPNGFKLIDKDFHKLIPNHNSIANWNDKMVDLFSFLKIKIKDNETKRMLHSMETEDIDENRDRFCLKTLWCLHMYLFPTDRFWTKDNKNKNSLVRYTAKDSQKAFIHINRNMQALDDHIQHLKEKQQSIQPFILAIGDLNDNITDFFVFFNNRLVPSSNFLRSVDLCFKTMHLFNLEYPTQCISVWNFIEMYFFEINSNCKKNKNACVLINELLKKN